MSKIEPLPTRQECQFSAEDKLSAQLTIYRIEYLVINKQYSRERLWRSYFDDLARKHGSYEKSVILLIELGYGDEAVIEYLLLAGFSETMAVGILNRACWSDVRMAAATVLLKDKDQFSLYPPQESAFIALDFLIRSRIADSRVIKAMFQLGCLSASVINRLSDLGWDDLRFFSSLVESDCFTVDVYGTLTYHEGATGGHFWDDGRFLDLMEDMGLADGRKVSLFRGCGKLLFQISDILDSAGWDRPRIFSAFLEDGIAPVEFILAYASRQKKKLLAGVEIAPEIEFDNSRLVAGLVEWKVELFRTLQQFIASDRELVSELLRQDWSCYSIMDLLWVGGWDRQRIISAMLALDLNEFILTKAVNDLSDDYFAGGNSHCTPQERRLWKLYLTSVFPADTIANSLNSTQ